MSRRHPPASRPRVVFDDRVHSASIGTLATAFCVGGVLTLLAFNTARTSRNGRLAGPADGAPLMRAPLRAGRPVCSSASPASRSKPHRSRRASPAPSAGDHTNCSFAAG